MQRTLYGIYSSILGVFVSGGFLCWTEQFSFAFVLLVGFACFALSILFLGHLKFLIFISFFLMLWGLIASPSIIDPNNPKSYETANFVADFALFCLFIFIASILLGITKMIVTKLFSGKE
jgi:hypothetical protein